MILCIITCIHLLGMEFQTKSTCFFLCSRGGGSAGGMRKKKKGHEAPFLYLLYDSHFVDQVATVAELVDDEENVADIYCDTTLEVVVEVDITTQ